MISRCFAEISRNFSSRWVTTFNLCILRNACSIDSLSLIVKSWTSIHSTRDDRWSKNRVYNDWHCSINTLTLIWESSNVDCFEWRDRHFVTSFSITLIVFCLAMMSIILFVIKVWRTWSYEWSMMRIQKWHIRLWFIRRIRLVVCIAIWALIETFIKITSQQSRCKLTTIADIRKEMIMIWIALLKSLNAMTTSSRSCALCTERILMTLKSRFIK